MCKIINKLIYRDPLQSFNDPQDVWLMNDLTTIHLVQLTKANGTLLLERFVVVSAAHRNFSLVSCRGWFFVDSVKIGRVVQRRHQLVDGNVVWLWRNIFRITDYDNVALVVWRRRILLRWCGNLRAGLSFLLFRRVRKLLHIWHDSLSVDACG